jgi:hypothetical protein
MLAFLIRLMLNYLLVALDYELAIETGYFAFVAVYN